MGRSQEFYAIDKATQLEINRSSFQAPFYEQARILNPAQMTPMIDNDALEC